MSGSDPVERILSLLDGVKKAGPNNWKACCPAHEDTTASLSVGYGDRGKAIVKCFADCTVGNIVGALGLTLADLFPSKDTPAEFGHKNGHRPATATKKARPAAEQQRRIAAVYHYTDEAGALLYQNVRYDPKDFRQRRPNGAGGWIYSLGDVPPVPYRLPEVVAAVAKQRVVFVVEGEKDANNLSDVGLVATTNSAGTGSGGQWQQFAPWFVDATVVIVPDNDEPGRKHAQKLAGYLHGTAADVRVLTLPGLPEKGDVSDWLKAGGTADKLRQLADATPQWNPEAGKSAEGASGSEESGNSGTRKPSAATLLIAIAQERCDFWHTADLVTYATWRAATHKETWPVASTGLRRLLRYAFFQQEGKAPTASAMQDAISQLDALAGVDGEMQPVYTRKADLRHTIYLDLCDELWRAVKITAEGWEVVTDPPVRFRRGAGMLALPAPERGGNIADLRAFVNVKEHDPHPDADADQWPLLVGWLLADLGPHRPYPVLNLAGEQGSAKSSTAKILRALVDPAKPALRPEPGEERDLAIAATNAFCVALDNLSGLSRQLSDAICRLSTGGGFGTRKNYTDNEEALFDFMAPVILTGIGESASRPDLLDRSLLLTLPTIPDEKRKLEADVLEQFEAARPRLLGALLDAVAVGLKRLPATRLASYPRMADFARWIVACEPACGWEPGAFLDAYEGNRAEAASLGLEETTLAPLLQQLLQKNKAAGFERVEGSTFTGTAAELLQDLSNLANEQGKKKMPANARALSVALRRIEPNLRAVGVEVSRPKVHGARLIRVTQKGVAKSAASDPFTREGDANDAKYPPFLFCST